MATIDEYFLISDPPRSVTLKKKWMTTVLSSRDGSEQRLALLTWPRRSLVYDFSPLSRSDLNYVNRIFFNSLHKLWGFPFLQDGTVLSSQAASGQKILSVGSTLDRNFEANAPCVLLNSRTSYEVGTIDVLADTQITLETNLNNTWPAGTPVYPVLKARVNSAQDILVSNSRYGGISLEAIEDFDSDITRRTPSIAAFSTYKSYPVFHPRPLKNSLKQGLAHPYDYLAYLGKSYSASDLIETAISLSGNYRARDKETIQQYLDFFDYHKGRYGNFWLPAFEGDIVITAAFDADDTVITIQPIDYEGYWSDWESGRHVAIRWPDDTIVCREIVDYATDTLTLDSAIGKACATPETLLASFLLFSRFDIDEIDMKYTEFDFDARTELSFRSIPLETPT